MERSTATLESDLVVEALGGWTPVHRLFAERARRAPEAPAVASAGRSVSYGELDRWAHALARRLRSLGVGPEVLVGVCLPRSPELLASVLAVLEAGGAYVALDPAAPKERLAFQLRDCEVPVLLAMPGAVTELGESMGLRCVDPGEETAGPGVAEPAPEVAPGNLAYVIYTSGSTGLPKGVEISHGSLRALVDWHVQTFGVTAADRSTLLAGVGFDASVWEIWPYLATGATLAVVPEEIRASPEILVSWLAFERVTISFLPTPLAEAVLPLPWPQRTALRYVLTGGDRLHLPPPASVSFVLVNNYGPTEATVVATSGEVPPGSLAGRLPSIGRPLPHARAVVVDERLLPLPAGSTGELLVGGAGLARGYLRRPALTAESFVPDLFAGASGERLYRTGDLVRIEPGGEMEFLGRIDDQVKIRGHRIEPGEIEKVLVRQAGVQEAVVTARDGSDGAKRLVAYVVPMRPAPTGRELRELLLASLPDTMVPSGFVFLDSLPYTPSGKVDRRALPEPGEAALLEPVCAPRTPVESRLAELWGEVLGCGQVGIRDSFFELGGHSLLATRILSRVKDIFDVELSLRSLLESPTVADLAAAVEAGLLSQTGYGVPLAPLLPEKRAGLLPLSFAQEALWFVDRMEPNQPVYNLFLLAMLHGRLDLAALEGALDGLLRRHEALRTRFLEVDGEPRSEVVPPALRTLSTIDLSPLPENRRLAELNRLSQQEARRPFDLVSGRLTRAAAVRLSGEDYAFLFGVHHIVFDGWSEKVFWHELSELYAAAVTGHPSSLAALPVQYSDYVVWRRRLNEAMYQELEWWRGRLAGMPPLELPTDRPRPARQTFRGSVRPWVLPSPPTLAMRDLARRQGATTFMALLAAFAAVLSRVSGQVSFAVGTPIAGRGMSELDGLIGLFANLLPLRIDLSGQPGFRALLGRVREEALAAFGHQNLPFEHLLSRLNMERDLSRSPLFQVTFQVVDEIHSSPDLPGIAASACPIHSGSSKFDLAMELEDRGGKVTGSCEYSTDLFDGATVERLFGHLGRLIESAVADPDLPVAELPLLSARERRQLLAEWNGPAAPLPQHACLHRLVEEQAKRTPQTTAVVDEHRTLTYRELETASNRLAVRLQAAGAGPDAVVGVLAERSLEMVVGLLAVLKAGGAYLPLDPDYPAERLAYMVADSRVSVVLAQERLLDRLPDLASRALSLDAAADAGEEAPPPVAGVLPENLAYVIYTSGSTGHPKGTMVPHRAIVNHMLWMQRQFPLAASDRVLQKTPFSFDASVWEFWAPLLCGATLVMAGPGEQRDPAALVRRIRDRGATILQVVPSLLRALLESGRLGECLSLRRVYCGGEALAADVVAAFFATLETATLHNLYGPTEATVDATSWTCGREDRRSSVPIGRPIDNTSILILDRRGRLVPVGVPGELHIGGSGLARGYLGRPELSAERFVPDPVSGEPGARLYRTGDLARYRSGGEIEYLGRLDFQVKVRGVRIELGEVEAALASHPGVREVCVLARDERLVVYFVPSTAEAPRQGEIREFLRLRLPGYMVPSAYIALPELPLNPSGKVDHKALVRIAPAVEPGRTAVAYSRPLEGFVASLWEEVLGRSPIHPEDNFFDLGGHSLLAIRVVSRIREALGVELPVSVVLAEPTIAALARAVESSRPDSSPSGAWPEPVPRQGFLPLSPAQEGLWFLNRVEPGLSVYNIPIGAVLSGPLDGADLEAAFGALVGRHEPLRTRLPEAHGEPRQVIVPPAHLVLPVVDLAALPAGRRRAELERLGREQASGAFDLARGPLLRACLVRLHPREHVLLVTIHHTVFDGWSEEIFWSELSAFYAAAWEGRSARLPELRLQYADYAVWQLRRLEETLPELVAWWRRQLDGVTPLELPADRPRPAARTWRGDARPWYLPAPLAAGLRGFARQQGATPFTALVAAFSALLSRYTQRDDFAVGAPVAGRAFSELEGIIGMFVNMLALRTDLSGRPAFRELVARMRETVLAALDHQDLPFYRLIQEVNPERALSRNPLFQVVLQVVDRAHPLPNLPGIESSAFAFPTGTSKFDLDIELQDLGGDAEGIAGRCEFDLDLFDPSTIERFLDHFSALLAAAVAEPDRPMDELSFLAEAERLQLREWSGEGREPLPWSAVHRLFEEWARRAPEALAVAEGARRWSYAELDRRAEALARRLQALGVGPEVRVGVCLERSPELVVSVLAVLKAGGAYVALDPSHPAERLTFQLEDSRVRVVVARRGMPAPGVLVVAPNEELPSRMSLERPELLPGNIAYVIYTSGSTGRPKGVELTHGSLLNLVSWHRRAFELTAADRSALIAGVGFDASVWEIWPVLASGASLHVVPEEVRTSAEAMRDWLMKQGITATFLPTPLAEAILALEWPQEAAMRVLLTGGDRLHRAPSPAVPFTLVNNYGPTEGTVVATSGTVASALRVDRAPSIGRPIDGASALVLDRELRSAPAGVPGELFVGGAGLARGYVGRPDLTAESFVPAPAGDGERLYRTGDLVRFLAGGELEFLGRIDQQVKVRGLRIELGEIEVALSRHPGVRETAVLALERGLVAYVVSEINATDLASFLRRSLPDYMIPAAFVPLPSLPVNASGKVDRQALARMTPPAAPGGGSFADPVEELVASLWEEVLGRSPVLPGDNFFHLGGHSLLATRVLSRIREALGVSLPLQALFESPTLSALARAVAVARRAAGPVLPPLAPVARGGRFPLSFPQQRLWFMDRLAPESHTYNIPAALALRGALDSAALSAALSAVVDRHEVLRTRFVEVDGQPRQEILPPGAFAVPVVDLFGLPRELREREVARIGCEEAARPFVLSRGPLMRAGLVRMDHQEHVLLVTLHHIASDGWSEEILDRELAVLYDAALSGRPAPLPALRIQYVDFAVWQRSWPQEVLGAQLDWWIDRLAGLANLEMPTDRARPPVQTFRGETVAVASPRALTTALREVSRARRATLFMTLLAGWQALLQRITGQSDVAVGSPVANRNQPEIEELIGFFVNLLPLRTDCGGDPSFGDLLDRVRGTALEAYDHADVPFERLIDELGLERDLSRQALVQVMFSLHTPAPAPSLRGLESEPLAFASAVAKFDVTLGLFDRGSHFDGWIEYSADLFDRSTVARVASCFVHLLASAVERPERRLSELELLSPAQRHQLLGEWNDSAARFPAETLLHQLFEAAADRAPEALAVLWRDRELTFAELERRANQIAHLLRQRGVHRGTPVSVWMERSSDMVAGVLAVLKTGGYYVPLDSAWPADRVESILADIEAPVVLTRSAHLGPVLEMQWRLPALTTVVCLDLDTPQPAPEPVDEKAVRSVFDLVAERAVDRVTAGGFISSLTGEPFSEPEVDAYRDRVLSLAAPWLGPDKRVLEIGCGSGLLLWEIAPRVARCVGLDPSPLTQERNRDRAAELGLEVELPVGFAHDIESWSGGAFDLVLIASTAQFFPGPIYLERVVSQALRLLAPGGGLVIADVPDVRRQGELRTEIERLRRHQGLPARQEPRPILSVDEDFFRDLGAAVFQRETGFDNELRFRYDVVLAPGVEPVERRKTLLTSWHAKRCAAARLHPVAAPEDLAYVIHTSGSTGQPKGIVVQHRSVANLIHWINPAFGLGFADRVLFVTSLCFDLSVWDIFGVLAAGGCVQVASEEDLNEPERLVRLLVEEPITIWDSAPAALVRLAPLFPSTPAVGSRLRRVMLSGDWIPVTLPDRVRAAFPHAEVTSLGGATEATVWSNWYPIAEVDVDRPSIPYGRPMPNAQYHVLDAGLNPCPIGVAGDLHIGGDCLCVGYAHQPDLTAEAFVPDPFGLPGARLYRTGDRARAFADGNLEFLGRVDDQVKIRGFRIELGEIQVALARYPGVREAVVVAREDVPGDKRLVAYVVGTEIANASLQAHLRQTLPDYMIPAAFVALEELPVTSNGKLDRRALPAPVWQDRKEDERTAPRTPTEQTLAELWREILNVEHVGVHDSFFDLGGHSLLATQLVARMRESFRMEIPLRAVFQAPALGELAAVVEAELAAFKDGSASLKEIRGTFEEGSIRPVPRGGLMPLSLPQQRLWLVERLTPASAAYHVPYAFRLQGPLDAGALASALGALVERHEALRTRFIERDGHPWQEILLPVPFSLAPETATEGELERLAREEAKWPFDLTTAPPFRARLVRVATEEHALFLTLHHIAFDGWSEPILLDELSALYEAAATGVPARLPELPVQYADYAAWQRVWPEAKLADRLSYWTGKLAGLTNLDLPADRSRPQVYSFRGGVVPLAVPAAVAAPLRLLARRHNATPFMLLLAGWQALLHRISGQDDVVVGSPVAHREQPEIRGLIGFFVNLLPLRVDFGGEPSFEDLLGQVRRTALEAYEHAEVPFERLVDELRLARDLSRHPIFQVLFSFETGEPPRLRLPGVEAVRLRREVELVKLDLSLTLVDRDGEGLGGDLEYNTDLFDRSTVERLAGHLGNLLAAMAAAPGQRLSEIGLLTREEWDQLASWSGSRAAEAPPALLQEAFMARAMEAPGALAVIWNERRITYGELDEKSDRLAARLRELGVGPEVRVGLCSARTPDLVIGVLGILKAGGAYVPLDPEYPRERLDLIMDDARAPVLVAQKSLLRALPEQETRVVLLDGPELKAPGVRPPCLAAPDNLAYLIYTSGSTGRAKGVAIAHHSAVALLRWASSIFPDEDLERVLASTSICFDLSVFEIFLPLSRGGAVVLAGNALELPRLPAAGEVTLINTVPSAMAELVRMGGAPASVRTVNLAGEALPGTLVDEIYDQTSAIRVMNLYGPSEDTTYSTFAEIWRGTPMPSIGRTIDGTRAWVLDRAGMPVPLGVPGELHLGGSGLARGYLERPDFTAERFIPDPFGGEPGARLYRTGDLVRWLPDGTLAFLGRIDHQVKVRGFRIELGEVEAALARHPAVREAVVAVRGEAPGDRHLVAWVIPGEERPTPRDLQELLRASLPGPAVPSAFVVLDELPRTPNGKVDRRALPDVEADRSILYAAPSTPTGEALAEIWSRLLGVEQVGAHDSFFELGGHSLLASQLVSRIREAFGADVPLSAVFQASTLDALAAVVAASSLLPAAGAVLRPVRRQGDLPLSASQLRQWFLVQLEPESVDFNLPVAVRLEGEFRWGALEEALRALARRHEALRTNFVAVGGRPAAVVQPEIELPLAMLDLSSTPEAERKAAVLRAATMDSERPFDLTRGPLLRALLIRLADREGNREHLLVVTFHHIVFDGFSSAVFLRDLSALYEAAISARSADLPALRVQYVDYAAWQQEQLRSAALRAKLDRWKERLAGASQVLDLPTDRPRPAVLSPRGEMIPVSFPASETVEIRKLASREGVTLFMALLAGYASLLSRYAGQEDLNVGTFVANRPQPALERLIGFFVNTLVLRVDLTGDPSFDELLARVREMALEAFENQEVPFESLLDELETGRDLSRGPLFQVMFGLQNFAVPTLEIPGLTFRPVDLLEHARTNGDLAFWISEEGDALAGLLQLSTDLFEASTVVRMFHQMKRLLAASAAEPSLRLSELPLLSAEETSQILVEWNRPGGCDAETDALVHERFEHWARVRPAAAALESAEGREVLSYGELNRRGNQLAHRLHRLGVRTDSIVGIWAERCPEFVIGVLGVLKAGGAYMPLDPALPAERLAGTLRGSGVSVLLVREGRPAGLPPFGGEIVAVRGLPPDSPEDGLDPASWAVPESLAYVLFTSGSTGAPKGVLIPHSALATFAETTRRLYGVGTEDRVLQFSSLVFDISVEEIFTSWTAGAALVLRSEEMIASPARFLRACGELDVQIVDLPTAYWHELGVELAKGKVALPRCVRSVIFAGERALAERLTGWQAAMHEGVRLFNSYGPSETTPASSAFDPAEPVAGCMTNGLSIGKPMRGARLYVVDPELRPVPVGVAGELLIGGASLGRGYAGRPDLTAGQFIPSPFGAAAGDRVYRTGDRVRWLGDGNLEFLGRVDDQIKIRGFRVEPGEVAAVLCRHPAVRDAVVVPRNGAAAGLRLVAYAAADPAASAAELRSFLKEALPAYMVPSDFVLLESLPLTATGKVDRRALPEPLAGDGEGYAPPETATEELLAEIWAQLLGRERIGIFDNFFDLGGHSLLAPQVFSRIEETFQVALPLRILFEAPTVAQLSSVIERELLAQIEELTDEEAEKLLVIGAEPSMTATLAETS